MTLKMRSAYWTAVAVGLVSAFAAVPANAVTAPGCLLIDDSEQTQVLSPLPAPLRSTEGTVLRLRVPDPILARRIDLNIRIRSSAGGETPFGLSQFTRLSKDDQGTVYELLLEFPGDLSAWTMIVSETFLETEAGRTCVLSSERTFLAGGPPVQIAVNPQVTVQSTMRDLLSERTRRVFTSTAFSDMRARAQLTHRVQVSCRIGDDGAGNPVASVATLRIVPPAVAGTKASSAEVCANPPALSQGTTWTQEITRRYQVRVGAAKNGLRRWPWQVQLNGTTVVTGALSIRHTEYDRGYVRRIYSSNFDAYWNTCIVGRRKVWAAGGRLYCIDRLAPSSNATLRLIGP